MHAMPLNPTPIGFSPKKNFRRSHPQFKHSCVVVLKAQGTQTTFLSHGEIIIIFKIEHKTL